MEVRPALSERMMAAAPAVIDDLGLKYDHIVSINLCPGATHFGIPSALRARIAETLMRDGEFDTMSKYGAVLGSLQLRRLWAKVISEGANAGPEPERRNMHFAASELPDLDELWPNHELMITAGANQAFVNVVLALCDPGDEVLLILPYYFSHFNSLAMLSVKAVLVMVDEDFEPNMSKLEKSITSKSKALVLVNPGNPSGKVFSAEQVKAFSTLCRKSGIWLIVDEAYRDYVFDGEQSIAHSSLDDENLIQIYTASKAYGLAGWRVGAVRYPKRMSEVMRKVQDNIVTHASPFCQQVAYEVMKENPFPWSNGTTSNIVQLREVRRVFLAALLDVYRNSPLQNSFVIPGGAFYFFVPYEHPSRRQNLTDSDDLRIIDILATEHSVLVAPGFVSGMRGYIRISYGCIHPSRSAKAAKMLAAGISSVLGRNPSEPDNGNEGGFKDGL